MKGCVCLFVATVFKYHAIKNVLQLYFLQSVNVIVAHVFYSYVERWVYELVRMLRI